LRLDDLRGREGRCADRPHLALPHQIGEYRQRLLDIGVGCRPVDLVEVDVIGLQPAQRTLHGTGDPAARIALLVRIVAHRSMHLGGQHHMLAPALQRLADDLLGLAAAIPVGRIDEIDTGIQRLVDHPDPLVMIRISKPAEHHCTQAIGADLDAGFSK
jgi:hypothetical protein